MKNDKDDVTPPHFFQELLLGFSRHDTNATKGGFFFKQYDSSFQSFEPNTKKSKFPNIEYYSSIVDWKSNHSNRHLQTY